MFSRVIKVIFPNGNTREVTQLQTKKWSDFSAPENTKIMRDIVHKTRDLNTSFIHPILVHCSAGVGRTGTFIAVYKLTDEYLSSRKRNLDYLDLQLKKKHLDVYSTVMEMREQRMKMVQRPEQYVYIFKCLRDEVKSIEGDYYEV